MQIVIAYKVGTSGMRRYTAYVLDNLNALRDMLAFAGSI
jgi:hypothetical protein